MRMRGVLLWAVAVAFSHACTCGVPDGDYFGHVDEHPDPTHLRYCNSGEPQFIDPGLTRSTTGTTLVWALWDGLTRWDPNGLPEWSIATSWKVSPDLRRFEFTLRKNAKWSNGRPLTAHDFVYHIIRVLHPLTNSKSTDPHWKLKNGRNFTGNAVRLVLRDVGGFKKGDIVDIIKPKVSEAKSKPEVSKMLTQLSYSNKRIAVKALKLRDFPGFWDYCDGKCALKQPYETISKGTEVTIIDLKTDKEGTEWAYIHLLEGLGIYGWVPSADVSQYIDADFEYKVQAVPRRQIPGVELTAEELTADREAKGQTGTLTAKDMIMVPSVVGVHADGDYKLVLETANPIPQMFDQSPQQMYRPSPREAVSRWPQTWARPERIVTSGPFHMTEHKIRDKVVMKKSETYWDKDRVKLQKFTSFNMNDQAASANYYFTGGCDAVTSNNLPSSYIPILNGSKGPGYKDYHAAPFLGIYFYLINTKKIPNVNYRKALSLAIDRRPIPKIIKGGQTPSTQLMPGTLFSTLSDADKAACGEPKPGERIASVMKSGELCYVPPPGVGDIPPEGEPYDYGPAKAALAAAKEEMGNEFKSSFTVKFNSGVEGHKLIAEYLQHEWKKHLGLDVTLQVQEWKTFLADTNAHEFEVARMGWILGFPDVETEIMPQFRCDAPDNRTQYCNPEFEALLDEAEATADRRERLAIIKRAEAILMSEVPVIPLYVYTQHHLQKPYVRDLHMNLVDQTEIANAWIDPNWRASLRATKPETDPETN